MAKKKTAKKNPPGPQLMRVSIGELGACEQLVRFSDGRQVRLARPPGNGHAFTDAQLLPYEIRNYRQSGLVVEPAPPTKAAPKGDLSEPQT